MTASAKVTYSNTFSQAWTNIYNLINNRTNVADPVTTNPSKTRKFVYAREPVMEDIKYQEAPYIVVGPIGFKMPKDNQTLDTRYGPITFSCTIQIVTCDRAHGRRDTLGQQDNDDIASDIFKTLNDASNRATLRSRGLPKFIMTASEAIPEELHDTLAYRRIITITSDNKLFQIST